MAIGIIANVSVVIIGGILGALLGQKMPRKFTEQLNLIFGICAMGMGISSIVLIKNLTPVILALVLGACVGLAVNLGEGITKAASLMRKPMAKLFPGSKTSLPEDEYMSLLVTTIVLFCASGTGIYGCLDAGMTGDSTILLSKSVLDLFTALVFACNLGAVVSVIAAPQLVIFTLLFFLAKAIVPLTTPDMINDFKACGGFILVATGLRIAKIKEFPIADMIPAMILVMPFSALWTNYIAPLL